MTNQTITIEFQKSISSKLEDAFNSGCGHHFMQKNNFDEIICVSEFFIDSMESKGYEYFSLSNINREVNTEKKSDNIIANLKKISKVKSVCTSDSFYDEYPDAYNQYL
jgi:hypothetical protein